MPLIRGRRLPSATCASMSPMLVWPLVGSQQLGCVQSYQTTTWQYLNCVVARIGRKTRRVSTEPGTGAPFDLMFDDVDAAHRIFDERGLPPSPIRRGRIHDSFEVIGPDGWIFTINSSHASGQPI